MTQQMVAIDLTQEMHLPAHLQGSNLGASAGLLAVVGEGGNRIGLKASRFRIIKNGKEEAVLEQNALDIIVVGAVPHVSRIFYQGTYNEGVKEKPVCFSEDGFAPPEDVPSRQSDKCQTCKQNQVGSKIVGNQKMKACGFFQRLVVVLADDPTRTLYRLDVKSQGLFGDSHANVQKYSLTDYTKLISNRGIDVAQLITRLSFDVDASVPKLLFQPVGFITAEQFEAVSTKIGSDEIKGMLKVDMKTLDLTGEQDKPTAEAQAATEQMAAQPVQAAEQMAPVAQEQAQANVAAAQAARQAAPAAPAEAAPAEAPKKHYKKTPKAGNFDIQKDFLQNGWTVDQLVEHGYIVEVPPPTPPAPVAPAAPTPPAAPPAAPAPTGTVQVQTGVPIPPARAAAPATPAAPAAPGQALPPPRQVTSDDDLKALIDELI